MNKITTTELQRTVPNYIVLEFGYRKFVFDYDTGTKLISLFKAAEVCDGYGENLKIKSLDKDSIEFYLMNQQQYLAGKMCNLLGVPVDPESMNELKIIREESFSHE